MNPKDVSKGPRPSVYVPRRGRGSVSLTQCRASVFDGWHDHQCTKPGKQPWTDPETGEVLLFCAGRTGHHPDLEAERRKASVDRYHARIKGEQAAQVADGLRAATNDQLLAECRRRGLLVEVPCASPT